MYHKKWISDHNYYYKQYSLSRAHFSRGPGADWFWPLLVSFLKLYGSANIEYHTIWHIPELLNWKVSYMLENYDLAFLDMRTSDQGYPTLPPPTHTYTYKPVLYSSHWFNQAPHTCIYQPQTLNSTVHMYCNGSLFILFLSKFLHHSNLWTRPTNKNAITHHKLMVLIILGNLPIDKFVNVT